MKVGKDRLQKWNPELVILHNNDTLMIDPEHPCVKISTSLRLLRLIANRNLCKRTLQKFCTMDGEHR